MNQAANDIGQLKTEIKKLLIDSSGLPHLTVEGIDDDTSLFQGGLGLDSIDILEFVVRLDKEYGLKILNDEKGQSTLQNVETIALAIRGNGH